MSHLDGVFDQDGVMSPQQIVERFKKVFGREMTPAERHAFFFGSCTVSEKRNYRALGPLFPPSAARMTPRGPQGLQRSRADL